MSFFLSERSDALELMDEPGRVSRADMVGCLAGIERVNRWLGGVSNTMAALKPLLRGAVKRHGRARICDVGTASADIPRAIIRWSRRERLAVHVVAVELNPDLAAAARRACAKFPEITVVEGDARRILAAAAGGVRSGKATGGRALAVPEPFDVATACLFLHHFPPAEVSAWLALMKAAADAVVVNDLERHPLAWLGIKASGRLFSGNRVFLHDAPLSVRRAYTPPELRQLASDAGLANVRLRRCFAWRQVLVAR